MTEAEWLAGDDPGPMLEHTRWTASDRKLRLFTAACARLVWDRLPPGEMRDTVELAERVADGHPSEPELAAMVSRLYSRCLEYGRDTGGRGWFADTPADEIGLHATAFRTAVFPNALHYTLARSLWNRYTLPLTGRDQPALIRCILGNPFRPATADPQWLTPPAVALAASIYESRAFHDLPVLADALEDAGCNCADVLGHLRGGGPHARGCWAVDVVLGKG